jgi:hypothetical protein
MKKESRFKPQTKILLILSVILVFLNLFDVASTEFALSRGATEANAVSIYLTQLLGKPIQYALYSLAGIGISAALIFVYRWVRLKLLEVFSDDLATPKRKAIFEDLTLMFFTVPFLFGICSRVVTITSNLGFLGTF